MKKITLFLTLICYGTLLLAQKKIALIVTIDNYQLQSPENPDRWSRTYANNDLDALWKLFTVQKFHVIDTLTESNATRQGILEALDNLAEKSEKGSTVVFSFSGHGQQIYEYEDSSKQLFIDEQDGYDEAIVPFDAGSIYNENRYRGEKHIRDEELSRKLNNIRKSIGRSGSLLVLIDACHSGTITKSPEGNNTYRGSFITIEPPGYKRNSLINEKTFVVDQQANDIDLAPMVVLSGSAQDQLNYPINIGGMLIGALTHSFIKAIENFKDTVSYKILFESIYQTITKNKSSQTPLIEGNDSIAVLDNKVILMNGIIALTTVLNKPDSVRLSLGLIHDISPGMQFFVYPLETLKDDTSLAVSKGIITAADPFNSGGRLVRKIDYNLAYKAVFISRGYGDFTCAIETRGNNQIIHQIRDSLHRYKNFKLVEYEPDLVIQEFSSSGSGIKTLAIIRSRKDDPRYDTIWKKSYTQESEISPEIMGTLLKRIRLYARAKYLRSLDMPKRDKTLNDVIVRIIPVIAADNYYRGSFSPNVIKELSLDSMKKLNSHLKMKGIKSRDHNTGYYGFKVEVINKGTKAVFLNILEISPDDNVYVRVPHKIFSNTEDNFPVNEFKIPKNDSLIGPPIPKILAFQEPFGLEYLKVIISDAPLNLNVLSGTTKNVGEIQLDDFLNNVMNDNEFNETFRKDVKSIKVVKPVRAGSMKIISLPFVLE